MFLWGEYWGFLLVGGQQSLEAKPLSPSSAKVKNEWSHTFISPFAFMACMGTTF